MQAAFSSVEYRESLERSTRDKIVDWRFVNRLTWTGHTSDYCGISAA